MQGVRLYPQSYRKLGNQWNSLKARSASGGHLGGQSRPLCQALTTFRVLCLTGCPRIFQREYCKTLKVEFPKKGI